MSHDPLETAPSQKTAGIRLVLVRPANDEQCVVVSYKFYEVVVERRANTLPPVNGVKVEVDPVLARPHGPPGLTAQARCDHCPVALRHTTLEQVLWVARSVAMFPVIDGDGRLGPDRSL
jgi:hypothetical protein